MIEVHPGFVGATGRSVALCALALSWLAGTAWASDGSASPLREGEAPAGAVPGAGDAALAFDIPSLPLADAFKRYAAVTRQPALFRSEILAGLTSSAVRGVYAPDTALELLLEGTGLVAEKVRTGSAVTLALRPAQARAEAPRAASLEAWRATPACCRRGSGKRCATTRARGRERTGPCCASRWMRWASFAGRACSA
ncbi:hypothetical protein GmRootV118_42430 [Variovorax sp. V118]